MSGPEILPIPRQNWLGRLLDGCRIVPGLEATTNRWQRVRRKRFLAGLKNPLNEPRVRHVLRHPAGQTFQSALTAWLAARPPAPPLLAQVAAAGSDRRCSVVINTVDRSADLAITLADLKSSWDAARDELIVVLGPTHDDSQTVAHRSGIPCQLLHCPERNLAISRNLGLHAASGRFIVFLDDDASPEPGWLDALIEPFESDPAAAVVSGFALDGAGTRFLNRYVVADSLGRSRWFDEPDAAQAEIARLTPERAFLTATGCNMAFRRDLLAGIGGFDPAYRYFLEETDAVRRLVLAGFHCAPSPHSRVRHRLGSNLARKPGFGLDERLVIIRSQLHYIRKFGLGTFPSNEIGACIWERVLADLEKIAWDCASSRGFRAGDLQQQYLLALAREIN